jgi:polyhydroxyalkanoate synthesis regulator phasin
MKCEIKYFFGMIAIAGTVLALSSCGSSKPVAATPTIPDEVKVVMYCNGTEYMSDKTALRFSAIGTSMDQMTSKKKALSEARAGLAAQIETKIKSVIDNYVKSGEHSNKEDLSKRYEGLSREVVNQNLAGTRTICEEMTKTKDGTFKTYTCVELGGPEILSSLNNKLSKDEMLKVDYDYEKFKKTFEDEMSKAGN